MSDLNKLEEPAPKFLRMSTGERSHMLLQQTTLYDKNAACALVNDYILLEKALKARNPFKSVTHFVAAGLMLPPYCSLLTEAQVNLLEVLYSEIENT